MQHQFESRETVKFSLRRELTADKITRALIENCGSTVQSFVNFLKVP